MYAAIDIWAVVAVFGSVGEEGAEAALEAGLVEAA